MCLVVAHTAEQSPGFALVKHSWSVRAYHVRARKPLLQVLWNAWWLSVRPLVCVVLPRQLSESLAEPSRA